jgi:DNA-binding transcriptional LysR family regulator
MYQSKRELNLTAALALADHRSFVAAAFGLKFSQPAPTRTVKRVENLVGVKLVSRTTRQVALTPAGRDGIPTRDKLVARLK